MVSYNTAQSSSHHAEGFLLDISTLFMSVNRLIGCPVLWLLLIGSYKTKSFISLAQALLLVSVLNESDKSVLCLNFMWRCVFFLFRVSPLSRKTNYSSKKDKNVKCLLPTVFPIVDLTCGYRLHGIHLEHLSNKRFVSMRQFIFAGFKTWTLNLFIVQRENKQNNIKITWHLGWALENVALNEQDTLFGIYFSRWQRMQCELWRLQYPLPCRPRRQSVCLRWQPGSGEEQCHLHR